MKAIYFYIVYVTHIWSNYPYSTLMTSKLTEGILYALDLIDCSAGRDNTLKEEFNKPSFTFEGRGKKIRSFLHFSKTC